RSQRRSAGGECVRCPPLTAAGAPGHRPSSGSVETALRPAGLRRGREFYEVHSQTMRLGWCTPSAWFLAATVLSACGDNPEVILPPTTDPSGGNAGSGGGSSVGGAGQGGMVIAVGGMMGGAGDAG